jgi:hypothetical protein
MARVPLRGLSKVPLDERTDYGFLAKGDIGIPRLQSYAYNLIQDPPYTCTLPPRLLLFG